MLRFFTLALLAFAAPLALAEQAHSPSQTATASDEASFMKENETAMNKMMAAMDVKPTGDIDRDFVAMMAPHHQGAIDMAVIELRYGKNETLKRLAQEIIVDQMQEINTMKLAIGDEVGPSEAAPTQPQPAPPAAEHQQMDVHMDMSNGMKK